MIADETGSEEDRKSVSVAEAGTRMFPTSKGWGSWGPVTHRGFLGKGNRVALLRLMSSFVPFPPFFDDKAF